MAIAGADIQLFIPMRGMIQSLNLSVSIPFAPCRESFFAQLPPPRPDLHVAIPGMPHSEVLTVMKACTEFPVRGQVATSVCLNEICRQRAVVRSHATILDMHQTSAFYT